MESAVNAGMYFFIYAALGWTIEVGYAFYIHRRLINRGFVTGPVCPMYGVGMLLTVYLLRPFMDNYVLLFLGAALIATVLEFVTGWLLDVIFKTKWWDYSDKKFNIKGYVCLSFSLLWGLCAVGIMLFLHPMTERLVFAIPMTMRRWVAGGLTVFFLADAGAAVISALRLKERLGEMQAMLIDFAGDVKNLPNIREELAEGLKAELSSRYESLRAQTSRWQRRLLKAYPHATTNKFSQALADIKKQAGDVTKAVRQKR